MKKNAESDSDLYSTLHSLSSRCSALWACFRKPKSSPHFWNCVLHEHITSNVVWKSWAFQLQIRLLKEPCEKARTINSKKKNLLGYKSATWSCGSGSPDFLVCFLQAGGRGAQDTGREAERCGRERLHVRRRGRWPEILDDSGVEDRVEVRNYSKSLGAWRLLSSWTVGQRLKTRRGESLS